MDKEVNLQMWPLSLRRDSPGPVSTSKCTRRSGGRRAVEGVQKGQERAIAGRPRVVVVVSLRCNLTERVDEQRLVKVFKIEYGRGTRCEGRVSSGRASLGEI